MTKKPIQKWHRITVETNDWEDLSKHMHKSKALMNNITVNELEPTQDSWVSELDDLMDSLGFIPVNENHIEKCNSDRKTL